MRLALYKSENYRSRKLLDSFRHAPKCFCCGKVNDGTVVGAHAGGHEYGKGMGLKAHDWAIAGLCSLCHYDVDQGNKPRHERDAMWLSAHIKTMDWLFKTGVIACN